MKRLCLLLAAISLVQLAARAETPEDRQKKALETLRQRVAEENARPIIFYQPGGTCLRPYVKGITLMVNSVFNSWRLEDVWLNK